MQKLYKIIFIATIFIGISLQAEVKWQQSEIANIQLSVRNTTIENNKEATFIIIAPDGKIYNKRFSRKLDEWLSIYFPGNFDEFVVKAGKYSWSCEVNKKQIATGVFSYDKQMNLKIGK